MYNSGCILAALLRGVLQYNPDVVKVEEREREREREREKERGEREIERQRKRERQRERGGGGEKRETEYKDVVSGEKCTSIPILSLFW